MVAVAPVADAEKRSDAVYERWLTHRSTVDDRTRMTGPGAEQAARRDVERAMPHDVAVARLAQARSCE